jgi:hypothetical protein
MSGQSSRRPAKQQGAVRQIPLEIMELFGAPPVLSTESRAQYDALLSRIAATVDPKDTIEWLWVKDITDLTWEVLRLRRLKTTIVDHAIPFQQLMAGDDEFDEDLSGAEALIDMLDRCDTIEAMIAFAARNRNALLREFDQRREMLGARLRQRPAEIIEEKATAHQGAEHRPRVRLNERVRLID